MEVLKLIGKLTWFFLPAGLANMAPVFVRQRWLVLARPIDGGWKLFGQPLFGSHKTWRGLIAGTLFGGSLFTVQKALSSIHPFFSDISAYPYSAFPWWFGYGFGCAAIIGDLIKSFFKRRLRVKAGALWFPFDQVDFFISSTLAVALFVQVDALSWLIILSLGVSLHLIVNQIGYRLKLKDTPW